MMVRYDTLLESYDGTVCYTIIWKWYDDTVLYILYGKNTLRYMV